MLRNYNGQRWSSWRALRMCAPLIAASCVFALVTSGDSGASSSGGSVTVSALTEYTGTDAAYGPEVIAGCLSAADAINGTGGILGHNVTCSQADAASDPADGVPVLRKVLATTSHLLMFLGVDGDIATAVVPVANAAHVTVFAASGQSIFNVNKYPYFWRNVPIDASLGFAMALAVKHLGYTKVAEVYSDTTSALGTEPSAVLGSKLLGAKVVSTQILPSGQTSYRSEVSKLLSAHPQVIVSELGAQTAAIFLQELRQANSGNLLPYVTDDSALQGPWQQAVKGAIGANSLNVALRIVLPVSNVSGPGEVKYESLLKAANVPADSSYAQDPYAMAYYDSVNLVALAAVEAHSIDPTKFNGLISGISSGQPGAKTVTSFQQGLKDLKAGDKIHYVGASGQMTFDKYHNWEPGFYVAKLTSNSQKSVFTVPTSGVNSLLQSPAAKKLQ